MPGRDPDDAPGAPAEQPGGGGAPDLAGEDARIVHITLDERAVIRRSPEVEQERAIAVYDLLEENRFRPLEAGTGPYHLHLRIEENRLILDIRGVVEDPRAVVALPLTPFRRVVRDYFRVCESYYDAIKRLSPSQIEAIDMGRRGLHNDGSTLLQERLVGRVAMDFPTARRLFTLLCVLHIRG